MRVPTYRRNTLAAAAFLIRPMQIVIWLTAPSNASSQNTRFDDKWLAGAEGRAGDNLFRRRNHGIALQANQDLERSLRSYSPGRVLHRAEDHQGAAQDGYQGV